MHQVVEMFAGAVGDGRATVCALATPTDPTAIPAAIIKTHMGLRIQAISFR